MRKLIPAVLLCLCFAPFAAVAEDGVVLARHDAPRGLAIWIYRH